MELFISPHCGLFDCLLSVTSQRPPFVIEKSKLPHAFSNQMKLSADICTAVQMLKTIFMSLFWLHQLLADTLLMLLGL